MNFITKIQTLCCLLLCCAGLANAQITCQSGLISHYNPNMVVVVNATNLVVNPNGFGTYDFAVLNGTTPAYTSSRTFTCAEQGVHTVAVRWTNPNMQVYTCTTTVTLRDTSNFCPPPAVQCQNFAATLDQNGNAMVAAARFVSNPNPNATYTVALTGTAQSGSSLNFGCGQIGTQNVTITQVLNGNTTTCAATVTITDPNNACATPIQCQTYAANLTPNLVAVVNAQNLLANPPSNGSYSFVFAMPNSNPTSGGTAHTFNCNGLGTYSATVTFINTAGIGSTCQTTFTVADPNSLCQPPALNCQNFSIALALPAPATATVSAMRFIPSPNANATYSVNFANMSSLNSSLTVTCNNIGTTAVTVQEQLNGAIRTCQANVVVTDPNNACSNPSGFNCQAQTRIITPNRVAVANASQFVANPLPNGYYTMSVGTPNGTFSSGASNYTFSCSQIGTYTVVLSQRAAGAIQTCTTSVVVADPNNICNTATPCINTALIDSNVLCATVYAPVCGCNNVTYSNSCEAENWAGVTSWTNGACNNGNPTNPITVQTTVTPATCAQNNCDGFINLTIAGGTAPYAYAWSNNTTGNILRMVCAGNYSVTITDANGLTATAAAVVTHSVGCVWPGDADDDANVSFFDVLPIALAYGESGFSRPNATINWQAEQCQDWNTVSPIAGLPNYKHIDTDGNGVVNQLDVQAVINNYGQFYYRTVSAIGDIPLYINDAVVNEGDRLSLPILLGSPTEMADNVYGIAFTIEYDQTAVDAGSLGIDVQNSWLGNDLMIAYREDQANGKLHAVISRKDRMNVSNFGQIGTLSLTIRDDILRFPTRTMPINITNVKLIDNQNTILGTTRPEATLTIELVSSVARQNELTLNVFPNPAHTIINIQSPNAEIQAIRLLNVTGQELQFVPNVQQNNSQINISELPNGIYMLSVITSQGISTQRVQVKR